MMKYNPEYADSLIPAIDKHFAKKNWLNQKEYEEIINKVKKDIKKHAHTSIHFNKDAGAV